MWRQNGTKPGKREVERVAVFGLHGNGGHIAKPSCCVEWAFHSLKAAGHISGEGGGVRGGNLTPANCFANCLGGIAMVGSAMCWLCIFGKETVGGANHNCLLVVRVCCGD